MKINRDLALDASLRGSLMRFVNHACSPNLEAQVWISAGRYRLGVFTLHDILAGQELFLNYGPSFN